MKQFNITKDGFTPAKTMISICLAFVLMFASVIGSFAFADEQDKEPEPTTTTSDKSDSKEDIAEGKEEVVYATLSSAGNVDGIYVVNQFQLDSDQTITDYGAYSSVSNLTSTEEITQNGETVIVPAKKGDFYYEGILDSTDLPWDFSFTYKIDGKTIAPEELVGKSGKLEIELAIKQNKAIDSTFYDNYMLQITFALNGEKASNIEAEGATIANSGTNKTIVYTVMPGNDAAFSIAADVIDFEMGSTTIAGMPYSVSIEVPDTDGMLDEMDPLVSAISELNEGVGQLASGTLTFSNGADQLVGGSSTYQNGMNTLSTNAALITSGSAQIKSALNEIATGIDNMGSLDFSKFSQLPAALNMLAGGLTRTADTLAAVNSSYATAYGTLDASMSALSQQSLSFTNLQTVVTDSGDSNAQAELDAVTAYYGQVQGVCNTYYASVQVPMQTTLGTLSALTDQTSQNSIYAMAASLTVMASEIQAALDDMDIDRLEQLFTGLKTLSANYDTFHEGLVAYNDGVASAAGGYSSLNSGIISLSSGARELSQGTQELYVGTTQLNEGMATLPEEMQKQIDEMMSEYTGADFDPISFVSPKNENVSLVQFVIMSEAIALAPDSVEEVSEGEKESSPWDQFLKLFG